LYFLSVFAPLHCVFGQEQSPEALPGGGPLERSLGLVLDTISLIESIQSDSERLKETLRNVSDMLTLQGQLLNEQAETQAGLSAISQRQSLLLGRELRKGKILKWSLIISAPVCTGLGVWLGWTLSRQRGGPRESAAGAGAAWLAI
jgi:hypothetical protein